jgi:type F conjugative transfer system pilin assembly protein TrbC
MVTWLSYPTVKLISFLCCVLLADISCWQTVQAQEKCAQQTQGCPVKQLKELRSEERYPRLLVFVSFSMPMATLKQLSLQAQEVGGQLVFRGLIKNSFQETIPKLKELGAEVLILTTRPNFNKLLARLLDHLLGTFCRVLVMTGFGILCFLYSKKQSLRFCCTVFKWVY